MKTLIKLISACAALAFTGVFLGGCASSEPVEKEPVAVRVLVSGAVMLPGQKVFWINKENPNPPTLFYAVGLSGGPTGNAYLDGVVIQRGGLFGSNKREVVNLREIMTAPDPKKKDVSLADGDIVEVYTIQQVVNMQQR